MRVAYLSHVDGPTGQRFEAQNRSVLVALPPLQHHVQLVSVPLQEVRILKQTERPVHTALWMVRNHTASKGGRLG